MNTTTLRCAALLATTLATACSIEETGPRTIETEEDLRAGGCGSFAAPGEVTQTCTYTAKLSHEATTYRMKAKGTCINESWIKCDYDGTVTQEPAPAWCRFDTDPTTPGCKSPAPGQDYYPSCNDYPEVTGGQVSDSGVITLPPTSLVVNLPVRPELSKLCVDPPDPLPGYPNKWDRYCIDNIPAETRASLFARCTDLPSKSVERQITCCVKSNGEKPCGATEGGGDDSAGPCEPETPGETEPTTTGADTPTPTPDPIPG